MLALAAMPDLATLEPQPFPQPGFAADAVVAAAPPGQGAALLDAPDAFLAQQGFLQPFAQPAAPSAFLQQGFGQQESQRALEHLKSRPIGHFPELAHPADDRANAAAITRTPALAGRSQLIDFLNIYPAPLILRPLRSRGSPENHSNAQRNTGSILSHQSMEINPAGGTVVGGYLGVNTRRLSGLAIWSQFVRVIVRVKTKGRGLRRFAWISELSQRYWCPSFKIPLGSPARPVLGGMVYVGASVFASYAFGSNFGGCRVERRNDGAGTGPSRQY